MAATIANAYIETFENNVRHRAQQMITKLRGKAQEKSEKSKSHHWERLGAIEATDKTGRLVDTPVQDAEWTRRTTLVGTKHAGDSTEQEDIHQMLVDPNSNITRALSYGMMRKIDDVLIAAATGTALTEDGTSDPFPASQKIGDGTAKISFDFVTQVQKKFMDNDIDPEIPKVMVVSPAQVQRLMQLTEMTSKDYVSKGLDELSANGIVPNWMGFTWITSTRLLHPSAGNTSCLAFTDMALGLHVANDIKVRVAEDPSKSFAWRLYAYMTLGAVRVEDEHIVHLHVLD